MVMFYKSIFVHGINTGSEERLQWKSEWDSLCDKHIPGVFSENRVATWNSSGDFNWDLEKLWMKSDFRNECINSIKIQLLEIIDTSPNTSLIVVGHSMGQVLSACALSTLGKDGRLVIPVSFLSLGGPLGNSNPVFDKYLTWAKDTIRVNAVGISKLKEWIDVFNPDDPVCHSLITGSHRFSGVKEHVVFKYPGKPPFSNPLAEHSSYFKNEQCFQILKNMAKNLGYKPNTPIV